MNPRRMAELMVAIPLLLMILKRFKWPLLHMIPDSRIQTLEGTAGNIMLTTTNVSVQREMTFLLVSNSKEFMKLCVLLPG